MTASHPQTACLSIPGVAGGFLASYAYAWRFS